MPRARRQSVILAQGNQRLVGATEVDANLDLGNSVSVAQLAEKCQQVQALLTQHNALTVQLDSLSNSLTAAEKELKSLASRMLSGIRSRYGADSDEYEKAGGVRVSERKRSPRRSVSAPA